MFPHHNFQNLLVHLLTERHAIKLTTFGAEEKAFMLLDVYSGG
jgi:hypothetical protein